MDKWNLKTVEIIILPNAEKEESHHVIHVLVAVPTLEEVVQEIDTRIIADPITSTMMEGIIEMKVTLCMVLLVSDVMP